MKSLSFLQSLSVDKGKTSGGQNNDAAIGGGHSLQKQIKAASQYSDTLQFVPGKSCPDNTVMMLSSIIQIIAKDPNNVHNFSQFERFKYKYRLFAKNPNHEYSQFERFKYH